MKRETFDRPDLELNHEKPAPPLRSEGLSITPDLGTPLTPAQLEFNRLMKRLENARAKYTREQSRLDQMLATSIRELMPKIEVLHRAMYDLVFGAKKSMEATKLSAKRRQWLGDLISGKASDLLADPVGLNEEEIGKLEAVIEELGPSKAVQQAKECEADDFDFIREILKQAAKKSGIDLDLSDLDVNADPAEFERALKERIDGLADAMKDSPKPAPRRKPTKAQLEKERQRQEHEEAKTRDFKSLYKQLAKALHPDLETDPELKQHKEAWMKRLTTAYSNKDLRDMLQIEMEWLGEEATHLTSATDSKLRVYCKVLKEQIADLKAQTEHLRFEPQYGPLRRFIDSFSGFMQNSTLIKLGIHDDILRHQKMSKILENGGMEAKKMMEKWADAHARASLDPPCPF